jgi:hypothetical protein
MALFRDRSFLISPLGVLAGLVLLTTCSVNQVGLGAKVDITAPKIAFTSPSSGGQYVRGAFTVAGTTSDDLTLNPKVTLSYPKASGGQAALAVDSSGGTWSFSVPSGTADGIVDGSSTLVATARDDSGKTTSVEINVNVDNIAPTILVTVPSSYGTAVPYSTSSYLEIKGEVYDPSPVTKVEVTLYDGSTPLIPWKTANGTNSWNTRIVYGATADVDLTNLVNKTLRYAVRATDKAGNVSTRYYHVQDFNPYLTTGALFPATDDIGKYDQKGTPLVIGAASLTPGSATAVLPLDGSSRAYGDFIYDPATRKPVVGFTNLDPTSSVTQNVLGFNATIRGTISPGIALGAPALKPTSFTATVAPLGSLTTKTTLTLATTPSNGSYAFQADV